jgi:signal transduction histidine kinase
MRPSETLERRRVDVAKRSPAAWWRASAASAAAILLVAAVAGGVYRQEIRHRRALVFREADHVVALEREFLSRELRAVHSDLIFLAHHPLLERLLTGDPGARQALEAEYLRFAQSKPLYDQIRVLNDTGHEVIRVNRRDGQVSVVERDRLQSKASRYYFREAIGLESGEIFVSPLDLNVERGEIEHPPRPVIRILTPVDSATGRRGLLVLNYAGARLLGKLREVAGAARGQLMLLNMQGQYLQAPDLSREWGWLLGHSASFREDHEAAWERIRTSERTQVQIGDDLFTAEWVPLAEGAASSQSAVAIVSRIPASAAFVLRPGAGSVALLLATLAVIVTLAFYWARASVSRRAQEQLVAESEARLRVLSSWLLAAQEEERKSLSRMLHDELGQRVTAIALDLKAALSHHTDAETDRTLRRAVDETEGVLSSLHEIATRVRPSVLDDLGLEDAIESFVSEYEERTGVRVDMELRRMPEGLPEAAAENVYRVVQEALSNVSAHAGADAARVQLAVARNDLELTIEDEGRGFDEATLRRTSRLGILGMRERVELLGGDFALETAPGRGTKIHVRLPLGAS